ncbi:hypothetical protein DAEQUDRAFT_732037 [Daedalea quercina L-15889]|uniref:Uncharacterized protein n=1 Tax=Daedalea quercina L-15889 TaxID=1314783 RepID=A0A165LWQ8_9APHY|nr:hypothetical protein DAEQUDRAFT_732037 [Daedalea quercina L-15889]
MGLSDTRNLARVCCCWVLPPLSGECYDKGGVMVDDQTLTSSAMNGPGSLRHRWRGSISLSPPIRASGRPTSTAKGLGSCVPGGRFDVGPRA